VLSRKSVAIEGKAVWEVCGRVVWVLDGAGSTVCGTVQPRREVRKERGNKMETGMKKRKR
jgi:hypothetical protein